MATNVYVVPTETVTSPHGQQVQQGKYFAVLQSGVSGQLTQFLYGPELTAMFIARDVDPAAHALMAAFPDCITVPDLAQNVGAQRQAVENALEALNLPAGWVTTGMSYGSIVRFVAIFFLFMQAFRGRGGSRLFTGGVTLQTQWGDLPAGVRTTLAETAQQLGLNTSGVTANTRIRAILKGLADQWPLVSIVAGEATL